MEARIVIHSQHRKHAHLTRTPTEEYKINIKIYTCNAPNKFDFPYQSGRIRVRMKARIVVHLSAGARRQHIQRRHVHEARRAAEHVESEMLETALDGIGLVPAKQR
jgi:hypothetical protein